MRFLARACAHCSLIPATLRMISTKSVPGPKLRRPRPWARSRYPIEVHQVGCDFGCAPIAGDVVNWPTMIGSMIGQRLHRFPERIAMTRISVLYRHAVEIGLRKSRTKPSKRHCEFVPALAHSCISSELCRVRER